MSDTAQKLKAVAEALGIADGALRDDPVGQALASMIDDMAAVGTARDGPMREIFARLGDKWSMLLLLLLRAGEFRHATLQRLVGIVGAERRISQRMLTLRLRSLERDGLVIRTVVPLVPPRVSYRLSPLGIDLMAVVVGLMGWVRANASAIQMLRERFDHDREAD